MHDKNYRATKAPSLFGLEVVLAMIIVVLLSSISFGQCPQWDVRRIYSINQSNNIVVKLVTLNQRGPRISGTASFQNKSGTQNGAIAGSMVGDAFKVEIKWDYGETGVYSAKRVEESAGKYKLSYLAGEAYIKEQPDNMKRYTTWKSSNSLVCFQGR
jgi:hypothetical protein